MLVGKLYHAIKKLISAIPTRLFVIVLIILLQLVLIFTTPQILGSLFPTYADQIEQGFDVLMRVTGAIAVVYIISKDENPYFKMSWIALFFFMPIAGLVIYLLMANKRVPAAIEKHVNYNLANVKDSIPKEIVTLPKEKSNILHSRYIKHTSAYPVLSNTKIDYYTLGDTMFVAFLEDLKKAEKYIFMEFFIVAEGVLMDELLEVLKERISYGVEVYFMYDDMGSLFTAPAEYTTYLKSLGINAQVFNPFRPRVSPAFNYRDHRKIISIDGKIAYCGGMNLADEYINKKLRFGHWKDTGVRLEGDAAWPFTLMFMQQWFFITKEDMNQEEFRPTFEKIPQSHGFVQGYADDPLAHYNIAENVYLDAIWQAKDYIYITSPYLVIDNAMEGALCYAATSGVDVRIITPKVYDKWYVHIITRSNYKKLIQNGVKIYEYTPGFVHSKMFVADDRTGMVGTSNMDFRSFYHHFECSAIIYENDCLKDIKKDILDCIDVSTEITVKEMDNQPIYIKIIQSILKLFAPLM